MSNLRKSGSRLRSYSLHAEDDADVTIAQKALTEFAAASLIKPVIDSTVSMRDVDKGAKL